MLFLSGGSYITLKWLFNTPDFTDSRLHLAREMQRKNVTYDKNEHMYTKDDWELIKEEKL